MITLQALVERDTRPVSVTVSMLSYNHEKYIDQAIQSVLMQKTNFPVNIVIHDDASTDRSAEIIRRYAAENSNIIPILEETNLYQNGKPILPVMLPYYTGKYMAYCECDDYWLDENKLQVQVDYLESNPDCVAVYTNTLVVNKYGEPIEGCYERLEEGDYSRDRVLFIRHQTASYVGRNFYTFMTPLEITLYYKTKANGDEKMFAVSNGLGRVHYFSEVLSAHRHVVDEGDSYSAWQKKLSPQERSMTGYMRAFNVLTMYEKFFDKNMMQSKLYFIFLSLKAMVQGRGVEKKTKNVYSIYKEIPIRMYFPIMFYLIHRVYKKFIRILLKILSC